LRCFLRTSACRLGFTHLLVCCHINEERSIRSKGASTHQQIKPRVCDGMQLMCWVLNAAALVLPHTAGGLKEEVCSKQRRYVQQAYLVAKYASKNTSQKSSLCHCKANSVPLHERHKGTRSTICKVQRPTAPSVQYLHSLSRTCDC
jgi:hypothetical protein